MRRERRPGKTIAKILWFNKFLLFANQLTIILDISGRLESSLLPVIFVLLSNWCSRLQVEMTGSSIFDYTHQQDHAELAEQLGMSVLIANHVVASVATSSPTEVVAHNKGI